MRNFIYCCAVCLCLFLCTAAGHRSQDEWISLFDGKSIDNWKVGGNAGENGAILA